MILRRSFRTVRRLMSNGYFAFAAAFLGALPAVCLGALPAASFGVLTADAGSAGTTVALENVRIRGPRDSFSGCCEAVINKRNML